MNGGELPNGIAIPDLQSSWFTAVFHVLWRATDCSKMGNGISNAQGRVALDNGMRANFAACTNLHVWANDRIRPYLHVTG
jgi:hypothetical protein